MTAPEGVGTRSRYRERKDSAPLRTLVETVRREGRVVIAIRPEWMRDYDIDRDPRVIETTLIAR